jgi:hypothetical protein
MCWGSSFLLRARARSVVQTCLLRDGEAPRQASQTIPAGHGQTFFNRQTLTMEWEMRAQRAAELTAELRERIAADAGAIMIFLGAGLSYGVGRQLGRAAFELPPASPDEKRFPAWSHMIDRMREELVASTTDEPARLGIERFFRDQDQLDCAQLFRQRVGEERYQAFLRNQFETRPEDAANLTPSHQALVELPVSEIFTTNYDRLIELAYERWGQDLAISSTPEAFLAQRAERPARHLIKLHGDIDEPKTIVLTRDDYARSRLARAEMFRHLAQEARFSSFLFVGFSLHDPTFNLIRDDARMVMGDSLPKSYLVQQERDPVMARFLEDLGVHVIELFSWNELPSFLWQLNPESAEDPAST